MVGPHGLLTLVLGQVPDNAPGPKCCSSVGNVRNSAGWCVTRTRGDVGRGRSWFGTPGSGSARRDARSCCVVLEANCVSTVHERPRAGSWTPTGRE